MTFGNGIIDIIKKNDKYNKLYLLYGKTESKMGSKDTYAKAYLNNNIVFVDIFNFFIYDGEQIINPDELKSVESTEISTAYGGDMVSITEAVQKYRDILKSVSIKQYEDTTYLLLGIEAQSEIHYAVPVKTGVYDMLQYEKQISNIATKHRKHKEYRRRNKSEFLSGFYKGDRLIPVVTLVIHLAPDKWDEPLSLYDMMDIKSDKLRNLVQNYKVNLIEPYDMSEEDFNKLKTDFQEVMRFIQASSDPDRMKEHLESAETHKSISTSAAFVIKEYTNLDIELDEGKEQTDMCRAIDILTQRAADEAVKETSINTARKLIDEGISKDIVVKCTGLTEAEVDELMLQPV